MGILERIKAIEEEMNRTQKNKATEYHLGLLKGIIINSFSFSQEFLWRNQ